MKKKETDPQILRARRWAEQDLLGNFVRSTTVGTSDDFDAGLKRMKDGLADGEAATDGILRLFERSAIVVLEKHHYPTPGAGDWWKGELWKLIQDAKDFETLFWYGPDGGVTVKDNAEALAAAEVILSIDMVRDAIAKKNAEGAALSMARLVFAAITANLHNLIIRGVRAALWLKEASSKPKRLLGVEALIEELIERFPHRTAGQLWAFLREYDSEGNAYTIPGHDSDYDFYIADGRLYQQTDDGTKCKRQSIAKGTFVNYVAGLKKKQ